MGRLNSELYSVSHSEMQTFKRCKRKWMLQYWMKLRRRHNPVSRARDTGTIVHAALHQFYTLGGTHTEGAEEMLFGYLDAARDTDMLRVETEPERKEIADIHDTSVILCRGYLEWLHETGADIGYTFDQSEQELRAPGPVDGTELMGIIDLGGTHVQSGDAMVMDTKVTNSFSTMLKTLHIQEQGTTYAILAKLNDADPNRGFRVVWNMIKRNKQTAKAKPPFYQRYELAINADQLRQFYLQLQGQMEEILRLEAQLNGGASHIQVAYPTPTSDCPWDCQFFPVCGAMNDMVRNDTNFLIQSYYSSPEEREAVRLQEEKDGQSNKTGVPDQTVLTVSTEIQGTEPGVSSLPVSELQGQVPVHNLP